MSSSVPDRWFDYSTLGNVIPGTPFIACKTPLKKILEDERRFTPQDLIDSVKTLGKNLVCVIDLTNTRKYYNKDDFQTITHVKIFTPGHVTPGPEIVSQFFDAVDVSKKNLGKDDVIAVHCTHGVNRTGYLVCRYMIDKLNFNPQKAIEEFNLARGHKIERTNYLSDLKNEPTENFTGNKYSQNSQEMKSPTRHQRWSQYYEQPYPNHWYQNYQNGYHYQNPQRQNYHYQNPQRQNYHYQNPPRHLAPAEYDYEYSRYDYENSSNSYPNSHRRQDYSRNGKRQNRERWRHQHY